jgi:hypothetical protein
MADWCFCTTQCCWVSLLLLPSSAAVAAADAAAAAAAMDLTLTRVGGKTSGTSQALLTFGLVQNRRGSSERAGGVVGVGVGMSSERT